LTLTKMKEPTARTRTGFRKEREMETDIVCTRCHRIRNAEGEWTCTENQDVLDSGVTIGYGLCSDCATDIYRKLYAKPNT